MNAIALLLALLAIETASPTPPPDFTQYFAGGHVVADVGFLGWEWLCRSDDDESCYAGLQLSPDGTESPAYNWVLTTGP